LRVSRQTAHETEQLGNEIMSDLTTQREALLRTQDKVMSQRCRTPLFNAFLLVE
jgi:hypothetical protein